MNRRFLIYYIFFLMVSCTKNNDVTPKSIDVNGKWILLNGIVVKEVMETRKSVTVNHFTGNQTKSSLDLDGSNIQMDDLIKNMTTWRFTKTNFILNDSLTYNIAYERYSTRVYGLENGSAKVLLLQSINEDEINFIVDVKYEAIEGVNTKYYSVLTFKRIS